MILSGMKDSPATDYQRVERCEVWKKIILRHHRFMSDKYDEYHGKKKLKKTTVMASSRILGPISVLIFVDGHPTIGSGLMLQGFQ